MPTNQEKPPEQVEKKPAASQPDPGESPATPREIGGRKGLDPTRYGDWEKNGRCIDF
jgi:hypothetical protein